MSNKYSFSTKVKSYTIAYDKKSISDKIQKAVIKEVKSEINKVLQVANRRMQNIENSGVASPAYKAIINELPTGRYTKFSIARLDFTNKSELVKAVDIYSKALGFLNQDTSTASGAKRFVRKLADQNKLPFEVANNLVDIITQPKMTNGDIIPYIYRKDIIEEMVSEHGGAYDSALADSAEYYNRIQNKINELINNRNDNIIDIFDL